MKKLMFAAALALGASCFAEEAIQSNIVGYHMYDLTYGFNIYTPVFEGASLTAIDIQDIKILESDGYGYDEIQILEDGVYQHSYYWWTVNGAADQGVEIDKDGWYTAKGVYVTEPVDLGDSLFIYADSDTLKAQVSGSVKLAGHTVQLSYGFNLVGNSTPNELNIQEIKLENTDGYGYDEIQILEDGVYQHSYYWWTVSGAADQGVEIDKDGWYTAKGVYVNEPIPAGMGLFVYSDSDGVKFCLPSPIAK